MISFTPEEQKQLAELGVEAVVLFGSQAQAVAGPASDYDFGIILTPGTTADTTTYNRLYDLLAPKTGRLTDIDIVFLHQAPLELQAHVAKYGLPLHQTRPAVFADFKQQLMDKYCDFAPLRAVFHQATLNRISP